jgi:hypothetical protein
VLYAPPPRYAGAGPVLIRIHRGRNGTIRTKRYRLD